MINRVPSILLTSIIILLFTSLLIAQNQILNPGFENWTGNSPNDWFANNPPTGPSPITPTLNTHSGNFAAQLRVVDFGGFPFPPQLAAGVNGSGFSVAQRHEALNGYYKFFPQVGDYFDVLIFMWNGGIAGTLIGTGTFSTSSEVTDWTQFSAPINYTGSEIPDLCTILIQVGIVDQLLGTAVVDDLSFGNASNVKPIEGNPVSYSLVQNYPNPFNPSTNIEYSIPEESFVELKVYDILGNEITTLISEQQSAGVYRIDFSSNNISAGLYFARLTANEFSKIIKMTLLK